MDNFTLQNKALIIIAKRNSGKSILIKYLVEDAIKHNEFNKIFVISSTNAVNHFYNDIIQTNCIFEKYSDEWTNTLIDKMSEKNKDKKIEIYFFFYYLQNDLYYWKFDENTILRIDNNCNYRGIRKKYAYIDTKLLTKIN